MSEEVTIPDYEKEVIEYLRKHGICDKSSIRLPFDDSLVQSVLKTLSMQGKVNSDGSRVWLG